MPVFTYAAGADRHGAWAATATAHPTGHAASILLARKDMIPDEPVSAPRPTANPDAAPLASPAAAPAAKSARVDRDGGCRWTANGRNAQHGTEPERQEGRGRADAAALRAHAAAAVAGRATALGGHPTHPQSPRGGWPARTTAGARGSEYSGSGSAAELTAAGSAAKLG
jgi:hypothetical protein